MVRTERIGYEALGIALVGYLAVDEPARGESRPGVVLMHEGGGQDGVDLDRIAAAGFCFGGVMALELARSTVPLRAAIGFHPGFAAPRPADSAAITASVLMICGAEDPVVSADDRRRFENEMREAEVAD